MANWMVSKTVGLGDPAEELDNEDSHVGGSREALQAS